MNQFLNLIEKALMDYASPYTPEGSEVKAVIHQWVHAIAYKNKLFAQSKGANKRKVRELLKEADCYTNAIQFKKTLRSVININPKFTFIDLFAGIGGMRQGFESVGGSCVFSSEFEKNAQQTYSSNLGY